MWFVAEKTPGVVSVVNCQDWGTMHVAVEGQCGSGKSIATSNACDTSDHRNTFPQSITMHNSQFIVLFLYMLCNIVYAFLLLVSCC